jgi:hypothetical protein
MNRVISTFVKHAPKLVLLGMLSTPPHSGIWGTEAYANCITSGKIRSCLKTECRAGICVHVATYYTPEIFTELQVDTRPARGTHVNLRCIGGQQKEGVFMKCGGSTVSVQSCIRGGLFKKSRCDPWQTFSGK